MSKCKLLWRIKYAVDAFKTGPLPVFAPMYQKSLGIMRETAEIETVACVASYYINAYTMDINQAKQAAKAAIARSLADVLLSNGYVTFEEHSTKMALVGRVRVLKPEEEGNQ